MEITGNPDFYQVKRLAWLANVTVAKLCEEAGISESTVYRWADNEASANTSTLRKLEQASERLQLSNPYLQKS